MPGSTGSLSLKMNDERMERSAINSSIFDKGYYHIYMCCQACSVKRIGQGRFRGTAAGLIAAPDPAKIFKNSDASKIFEMGVHDI